ncbi:hypothetical protein ELI43_06835 [Rhizobium leguminosarum]|uniref:hypothetical protein n=1 Tax=Rhizobium leguminosarum TaxID=384 RepID=UPI00103141F9|nr:hypothetical protein [Rhizobium leguminosarum]TAU52545.1 hypothetical protein ELI43_06835 [Rhizobium leguminosarum]
MSHRFGLRKPQAPAYLWPASRMRIFQLSVHSLFADIVWKFDTLVAGQTTCSINWRLGVPNEMWVSLKFQRLLRDAKRFLVAYLVEEDPRPNTFVQRAADFRQLIIWMFQRDYRSFAELGDDAREEYFNHMCARYYDVDRKIRVVDRTIDMHMSVVTLLFKHRDRFSDLTRLQIALGQLRNLEWNGSGRKLGAPKVKNIPAVPEGVFNPMMKEALCWVDHYSADIIELVSIQEEAASLSFAWNSNNYTYYINRRLEGYRFKTLPGATAPWRHDLKGVEYIEEADEEGHRKNGFRPLGILRELINNLVASCAIVIQGFSGIRVSELMGLRADAGIQDIWPSCIDVRASVDGLNDVFLLEGEIFKGICGEEPREGHWVVGIRPVGSDFIPPVVRALNTLLSLLQGWRKLSQDDNVFLYPTTGGIPRRQNSVGGMLSETLRRLQQNFLWKCVRLPVSLAGWPLTSHQFRKKFAQDIVRCDPDAMPAIREHFKHVSMHILETGYLGNDAELLETIDEYAMRDAAAQIMAILDGELVAGKMSDEIRSQLPHLKAVVGEKLSEDERRQAVLGLVSAEGVRAWPCDFGTCMFRAETALCHLAGKGYYDGSARRPLATERCADLCCRCANLLVSGRNVEYWKKRYITNENMRRRYRDEGETSWGLLAARRARIAAIILKSHDVNVEVLADAA